MNLNEQLWDQTLSNSDEAGEEGEELRRWAYKFLIPDNISPQFFLDNYQALADSVSNFFNASERKTTTSLEPFKLRVNRPLGLPTWFIAGYPDVCVWLQPKEGEGEVSYVKRLGEEVLNVSDRKDDEGHLSEEILRKLIETYKQVEKVRLECQCSDEWLMDKESSDTMRNILGLDGTNFQVVARNTTKYYKALKHNYNNKFSDMISLLTLAGVLDAQYYVFIEKKVTPDEILHLAKKTAKSEKPLLDFIIELEILLFSMDENGMALDEIRDACEGQKKQIEAEIETALKDDEKEEEFNKTARAIMEDNKFQQFRNSLGIKNKVDYDKRTKLILWIIGVISVLMFLTVYGDF